MTTPRPTSFNPANTHRVLLLRPEDEGREFDRLEDLTADGLAAARTALAALSDLPNDALERIHPAAKELAAVLAKRRLLSTETQSAIDRCLHLLERAARTHADDPGIARMRHHLGEARAKSERVLDLLAAERDVAWQRGLRS